mmetsp:Transcript_20099/g.35846  ORF Transcript_20099/g.35846 Transcript_20099/m.35846 type:complete len:141 (+) Transcript_20099:105-527(+)
MEPEKLAVRFRPPTMCLLYSFKGQKRVREFSLDVTAEDDGHRLRSVVTRLKEENPDHLLDIGTNQLLRLVVRVRDALRKNGGADLNKVSENMLVGKKLVMDVQFRKNQISSDDPKYVYDKRIDFQGTEDNDWDDDDDDDD